MANDKLSKALEGTPAEPKPGKRPPSKDWTVSVYLGPERKSIIERLRSEWGLNQSQTIRVLLDYSLAAVDKGKLAPEIETVRRAKSPAP